MCFCVLFFFLEHCSGPSEHLLHQKVPLPGRVELIPGVLQAGGCAEVLGQALHDAPWQEDGATGTWIESAAGKPTELCSSSL